VTQGLMADSFKMFTKRVRSLIRRLSPLSRQLGLFERLPDVVTPLKRRRAKPARPHTTRNWAPQSTGSALPPLTQGPINVRRAGKSRISDSKLASIWAELIHQFFPERTELLAYTVAWSTRRQRRTLASCNLRRKLVNVALELNRPDCDQWLNPLLFHELCHAVLGENIGRESGRRAWHGREFRELERRHPQIKALDLWIKQGGWKHVVRSNRAQQAAKARRK